MPKLVYATTPCNVMRSHRPCDLPCINLCCPPCGHMAWTTMRLNGCPAEPPVGFFFWSVVTISFNLLRPSTPTTILDLGSSTLTYGTPSFKQVIVFLLLTARSLKPSFGLFQTFIKFLTIVGAPQIISEEGFEKGSFFFFFKN